MFDHEVEMESDAANCSSYLGCVSSVLLYLFLIVKLWSGKGPL